MLGRTEPAVFSWGVVSPFYIAKNEIYSHGKETRRKVTFIGGSRQLLRERGPAGSHISPITVMAIAAIVGIIVMVFNLLYATAA